MAVWLEELGAAGWEEREEASRRFIDSGAAAVPFLKANMDDPDPEVRARVRSLLQLLDPLQGRATVARLAVAAPGEAAPPGGALREWLTLDPREEAPASGSTSNVDGPGTQVEIAISGDHAHPELTVELLRRGEAVPSLANVLVPGHLAPLYQEEILEVDRIDGGIECVRRSYCWLVWYEGPEPRAAPDRDGSAGLEADLFAALSRQLSSPQPDAVRDALAIVRAARAAVPLPEAESVPPAARIPCLETRRVLGDPAAARALEEWLEAGLDLEPERASLLEVCLGLAAAGSAPALDRLLDELARMNPWFLTNAITALEERLRRFPSRGDATRIVEAVLKPERMQELPWAHPAMELLLLALEKHAPEAELHAALVTNLRGGLGGFDLGAPARTDALLRAVLRQRRVSGERFPIEDWFDPVVQMLASPQGAEAFALLRDARLSGELDDTRWQRVLAEVEQAIPGDPGAGEKLDAILRTYLALPGIDPAEARRVWELRLRSFLSTSGPTRLRVDGELERRLGRIEGKPPAHTAETDWSERRDLWRERIAAAPDASLLGIAEKPLAPPAGGTGQAPLPRVLRLTKVDFRLDHERRSSRVVRYESRELEVGRAYPDTGPDGTDRTTLLSPQRATRPDMRPQFHLATGERLHLDTPNVVYHHLGNSHRVYSVTPFSLAPQIQARARRIDFQTLLLLEDPAVTPPAPSWAAVRDRTVGNLVGLEAPSRSLWLDVIRDLYLADALDGLRTLYRETRELELARTLLQLGDASGYDQILAHVVELGEKCEPAPAMEAMEELLALGDRQAIDIALGWMLDPALLKRGQSQRLLRALAARLEAPDAKVEIDGEKLLAALVASLAHSECYNHALPLLERRAGRDFGYQASRQGGSAAEQKAARDQVVWRVREWWNERVGATTTAPSD